MLGHENFRYILMFSRSCLKHATKPAIVLSILLSTDAIILLHINAPIMIRLTLCTGRFRLKDNKLIAKHVLVSY